MARNDVLDSRQGDAQNADEPLQPIVSNDYAPFHCHVHIHVRDGEQLWKRIQQFQLIRRQGAISDRQFLRSMIPHHASAILMCNEARIQDQEIKDLCKNIIMGQQAEIDQMKAKLDQLTR